MAITHWTEDLSIGIESIDEQHKTLIKHLDDFAAAITSRQGPSAISTTLDFLIEYTNFHFADEEKHMTWTKYPGLQQQMAEHEEFRKTLTNVERDFKEDGATHELANDINTLLIHWLVNHIHTQDLEFGKFLRANGITISDTGRDTGQHSV